MTTKREYERFLAWLHAQPYTSDDVKRIGNIIYANFLRIETSSSNQGQRTRILAPLLKANLAQTSPALPAFAAAGDVQGLGWQRLRQLVVGPFRGFRAPEVFDLNKRIILFYGPNGTGKTSLCEALEYGLLGEVEEANAKRISSNDYLKNVHARRYIAPTLTGTDADGNEVPVASDMDAFRFCFVEKNRIESFSRIAARTPAQRSELIASLFGLEGFADFVRNFNVEIDQQLTLREVKGQELARKRQVLVNDQTTIATETAQRTALIALEIAFAHEYQSGLTYEELVDFIGSDERPGRLHELDQILAAQPPAEYGVTAEGLQNCRNCAEAALADFTMLDTQLAHRRAEVNFKALYDALQGLELEELDYCPACTTPLHGDRTVARNPFERARVGLAELADLASLQRQQAEAARLARRASEALRATVLKLSTVNPTQDMSLDQLNAIMALPEAEGDWWMPLDEIDGADSESGQSPWQIVQELARRAELFDQVTRERVADRERQSAEQARLRNAQLGVTRQKLLQEQLTTAVAKAAARVAAFEQANQVLVREAETERLAIEAHRRLSADYGVFLHRLRTYKDQLPQALTADLSETALDLYNGFNRYDHDADRLAQLSLPTDGNGRILIAFNSHPTDLHDALLVMSEGHIRCLGLAILMAKNIKQGCPVVIFDDAVNAIDNEHRLGIRDTLFDNQALEDKQILVTCHGEELIKDIEVHIGHRSAKTDCLSYTFLPHDGDRVIKVIPGQTRNYVLSARNAFNSGRIREALGEARRATEALSFRTWQFLARVGHGELHLKLERAKAPVKLYNLATELRKKIDSVQFVHEKKAGLSAGFQKMLGAREWALLNPGTHEAAGIEDFPHQTVRTVIDNLATLDDVLSDR